MKKVVVAFFWVIVVFFLACEQTEENSENTEEPVGEKEHFLPEYLTITGFDEDTGAFINSSWYEFGVEFTALTDGKITDLIVQLPDTNPSLRITIWNSSNRAVLHEETVEYSTADVVQMYDIADLSLEKDSVYAITLSSNDWYNRRKANSDTTSYPIQVGNILLHWYGYTGGTAQQYPISEQNNYYAGDLSFYFLKD